MCSVIAFGIVYMRVNYALSLSKICWLVKVCVKFNKGNRTLLGENLKNWAFVSFTRCFSSVVDYVNYFFRAVNSRRLNWRRYHKDRGRCKQNARGGISWAAATGKNRKEGGKETLLQVCDESLARM